MSGCSKVNLLYMECVAGLHTGGGGGALGFPSSSLSSPSPPPPPPPELGQGPTLNTKNFLGEHATRPPRGRTNVCPPPPPPIKKILYATLCGIVYSAFSRPSDSVYNYRLYDGIVGILIYNIYSGGSSHSLY